MKGRGSRAVMVSAIIGGIIVVIIMILGTLLTGRKAKNDTEQAVRSVNLLYLDELAGRREQVVASNLEASFRNMNAAIDLLTKEDLTDVEHLQAFQARMKRLYELEQFAFVDSSGLIYTALGTQENIDQYPFDYASLSGPVTVIKNQKSPEKKVILAVPIDPIPFSGDELIVCFMEIDMDQMLSGVSMQPGEEETTFCNIYTHEGTALTDMVLGGLASEDNLLSALEHASFEPGYSMDQVRDDFETGRRGVVSFSYNGIRETLSYVPVDGTDWFLTYLIRESVISDQISSVSDGIILRSLIQSVLTAIVLLSMFSVIILQTKKTSRMALERETSEAENRVKQQALEQRLALQEQLLEQEKYRAQQDSMISALASDYRSVYYVSLDTDEAVCYRTSPTAPAAVQTGRHFSFRQAFTDYANLYVAKNFREDFLAFIEPDNIRKGLENSLVLTFRYLIHRNGEERYEMLRMASVRQSADKADSSVHELGVGFTDIDAEMRESMVRNQALNEALAAAEEASKAKTAFLSNMSHEIRTPMNAIIGLQNIAVNDPDVPEKTRGYLEKIGSSAQHLLTLINDILDMSRIESGRLLIKNEEFSFSSLIEQVNTLLSGQCLEKKLHYRCRILSPVDDYYIGDNMKLRQVLVNILGNAVKFTPEGGNVDFSVERTAQFSGQSTLRFVIADTGIGISREYLPRIFDAFSQEDSSTTSKYGSSGLGMAITKSIVERMNGKVEVESEKGRGTTFTVTVTLMDSDRRLSEEEKSEIHPQELSVLIIDDDPIACEHARLVLEKVGIASESATSGEEAIEMVRLRHARRNPYHLILVDWKMPGMDGVETTRRIRSIIGNESAIIILTAYRWDDIAQEALDAGVDTFLPKPLFASSVIEEFRDAMAKKNLSRPSQEQKADLKGRHILVAEDVAINAEILIMLLSMREMQIDLAENGRIAVDKFSASGPGYYDAILMDMRMPEMDGLQATAAIRAMDRPDAKAIPIIALTANAFDEDVQRSLQAGLNAHLTKPVDPNQLYQTLESLIPS